MIVNMFACLYKLFPWVKFNSNNNAGGNQSNLKPNCNETVKPMPSADVLNDKFTLFLTELDLSDRNKEVLMSLSEEKKWLILCEELHRQEASYGGSRVETAEQFVQILNDFLKEVDNWQWNNNRSNSFNATNALATLELMRVSLRTEPNRFIISFLELKGLEVLIACGRATAKLKNETLLHAVLQCIKSLFNNSCGQSAALQTEDTIMGVVEFLISPSGNVKAMVLEMLGALCLIPGGHSKVLSAFVHFKHFSKERLRFQHLLDYLIFSFDTEKVSLRVKTAALSLINALLKAGISAESLPFRTHLRWEFLTLGIQFCLESLSVCDNPILANHIDLFEMMRQEDEMEFARLTDEASVDVTKSSSVFACLQDRLESCSDASHNFLSILQHLLLLPTGKRGAAYMGLIDIITQQVVLQEPLGNYPDLNLLEANLRDCIKGIQSEVEVNLAYKEISRLNSELNQLGVKIISRPTSYSETSGDSQRCSLTPSSNSSCSPVSNSCEAVEVEAKFPHLELISEPNYATPTVIIHSGTTLPPPPPPPLPPKVLKREFSRKKNIPKATRPLKLLNWSKISSDKIVGTVWADMHEEKFYKLLDLSDFDTKFATQQKAVEEELEEPEFYRLPQKLSLIDPRRAHILTILLSKFKIDHNQLIRLVSNFDPDRKLNKDMLEQLLKFLPTKEEISALSQFVGPATDLAVADRFLLEVSRIPMYEERLRHLHYMTNFPDFSADLSGRIQVVNKASVSVKNSKRLRLLLELILAVGNYMNCGRPTREASAFHLSMLRKLSDTKSNAKKGYSLLHFILETAEAKFPELLRLKRDLIMSIQAAKVSAELFHDVDSIRKDFQRLEEFLLQLENQADPHGSEVLAKFLTTAAPEIKALEKLREEMLTNYRSCLKTFGESDSLSSEDFFGDLAAFVVSFTHTYKQIQTGRELAEAAKRQNCRTLELKAARKQQSLPTSTTVAVDHFAQFCRSKVAANGTGGEFDQLVSALQSGELFTQDLTRLRASFKGNNSGRVRPGRNPIGSRLSRDRSVGKDVQIR